MDTRFWGPSGWRLLHLITFTYEQSSSEEVKDFFNLLPYVLPCKFCRASLSEYMEEDPIDPHLDSQSSLTQWLYRIHNSVNKKLRGQGLLKERNPSFSSVKKVYEDRVREGCMRTTFEGWDFLFSIAENHPLTVSGSSPMPDMPEEIKKSIDPKIRNRWNILSNEERMVFYTAFWKRVGDVLPFQEWRDAWQECSPEFERLKNKKRWKKELWRIRCCLENRLELVNKDKYESVCKKLEEHTSGCNKKKRAKTCRKKK